MVWAMKNRTYGGESAFKVITFGDSAERTKPMGTAVARNLITLCHNMLSKWQKNVNSESSIISNHLEPDGTYFLSMCVKPYWGW